MCVGSAHSSIRGHLEPLGSHKEPEGKVFAMDGWPASPADFFKDFVQKSRPVLFRGAAKQMKAFKLWTDDYLSSKYGNELVEVEEGKKEYRDLGMWAEKFGSFLRKYQGKERKDRYSGNFYSVSAVPVAMRHEYELPPIVDCPAFLANRRGGMRQINHWFSSGGTSSVLHHDNFENINCLLDGEKDLIFINRSYSEDFLHWDHSDNHHHSKIDCDRVDLKRFPNFKDMPWWDAHMERGDCLYIPISWYHHVKSHPGANKRNYAMNLWWEMDVQNDKQAILNGCKDAPKQPRLASQVRFTREQFPDPREVLRDDL